MFMSIARRSRARVTSVEHIPGGFVPAFNKESENNERVVWHFDTELGDIEMIQIAGAVARRIVPYIPEARRSSRATESV